jgi:hypothetical protein
MAFPNNCNPRVVNIPSSAGCSLTRANIIGMTPQAFEDQGNKEVGMDKLITNAQEAKAAGYIENTLEMLLFSRLAPVKNAVSKVRIPPNDSVILPYIYRRQKRNINSNYFVLTDAAQQSAVGGQAYRLTLTIGNHGGTLATALPNVQNYFLVGKVLQVEWVDTTTNVAYAAQFTIISSVVNPGDPTKADVVGEPNYSSGGWGALGAAGRKPWQGLLTQKAGTVINLTNSISDYEAWCFNEVAENTNKLLTFWLQTSRYTHEYSDEYLKALNAALTSGYFKEFAQLPLAEQKRIKYAKFMRDWVNSVFYGQRINENQTVETYTSLPTVIDPNAGGCTLEYKARALGFKTMLQDCGRYLDHQGNPLSVDNLAAVAYLMKRAREADGGTVDTIDFMTDRDTAGKILQLFTSFYKAKYGVDTVRYYSEQGALKFGDQVAMPYNLYQLPPDLGGFNLAIFHHPYFDDKLSAFQSGQANRGRTMWGIDWTDVLLGIAGTSSAQRQTNIYDNLYNCVIKPNIHHYELQSQTWTAIIEDPNRHFIIDNFSSACPSLTVPGCTV